MYKVYKNVFTTNVFHNILTQIKNSEFHWFYRDAQVMQSDKDTSPFFGHDFYDNDVPNSPFYSTIILPFYQPLNAYKLINARANLVLNQGQHNFSAWHTDRNIKCKTAIWYANTCNGYTELKDDDGKIVRINCEENQLLIFDSYHQHRGVSQTDTKSRIVINFNFFEGEKYAQ